VAKNPARSREGNKMAKTLELQEYKREDLGDKPVHVVFRWKFTGNEADENYFLEIQDLAEDHGGEFYFAYAYKGIYDVEIGGVFANQEDADAFKAAFKKQPTKARPRKKVARKAGAASWKRRNNPLRRDSRTQ
jgi:hypothetical protein